ncbi:hypothetical protein DYH09_09500 [bacterium CPR1]|nr:hypothetical protein [bacterium CPR1]
MLLLVALALAETPAWRYDLAVQRFVDAQAEAVAESGSLLEDWLSGRISTERALEKLKVREEAVLAYHVKLEQAPCPKSLIGYRLSALQRSKAHSRALARIATFLEAGKSDRVSVQTFSRDLNRILSQAQLDWLGARQKWLPFLSPGGPVGYYGWQARILPIQRREAELSGRLQQLVYQGNTKEPDLPLLASEGEKLTREVSRLRQEAAAVKGGASHQAYRAELEALQRVAEAIALMGQDPSPDSLSRLRRVSRVLLQESRAAQQAALKELES